ncbi:hypothetical protein P3S68_028199 [Capsicum galapagoense]
MTKIIGTLGPKSRSVEVISSCLEAGMSVARCDFLLGDNKYHQETLDNLKTSIKSTKKLCAVNVADPELAVVNTSEKPITLKADETVTIIPDKGEKSSFEVFPINFDGLSKAVKKGYTLFIGQYLFIGNEMTSVWLKVDQVKGDDVDCVIKNSVMLTGSLFTLHAAQIHIDLPTLPDNDKEGLSGIASLPFYIPRPDLCDYIGNILAVGFSLNTMNNIYPHPIFDIHIDYLVRAKTILFYGSGAIGMLIESGMLRMFVSTRELLGKLGDLSQTQIFAKIESEKGLTHYDEIFQEVDGICNTPENFSSKFCA